MSRVKCAGVAALVAAAIASATPASAQFGMNKTEVVLNRKRSPEIYLIGTDVKVEVVAQNPAHAAAAAQLKTTLEAELVSHDPRLRLVSERPESAISVTVMQLSSTRTIEVRAEPVVKQTGTDSKGKATYGSVLENHSYVVIAGQISGALQVRDVKNSYSDTVAPVYRRQYLNGVGAPEPSVVQMELVRALGGALVARVTPTVEPIRVYLAKPNEIEAINKLAEQNLWDRMLEKLNVIGELKDKKKEPYRLYNLGVVNEAMAYAAGDIATSRKLLEAASRYYNQALDGKQDEKYFREPQERIARSIAGYGTLETMVAEYNTYREAKAAAMAAQSAQPSRQEGGSRDMPKGQGFDNARVILLTRQGLDEANMIETISGADSVAFDLGPDGLTELLAGKVSNKVISAMRARQARGAKAAPPAGAGGQVPRTTPARRGGTAPAAPAPSATGRGVAGAPAKPGSATKPGGGH